MGSDTQPARVAAADRLDDDANVLRRAGVQQAFGVPLPEWVQWERVEAVAGAVLPVFLHLQKLAARGEVLFADGTGVKILACLRENKQKEAELASNGLRGVMGEHRLGERPSRIDWVRAPRITDLQPAVSLRCLGAITVP